MRDHDIVLRYLAEESRPEGEICLSFAPIIEATKLPRRRVRVICRALTRKGLAEFHTALWDDDGQPRGAGYCISKQGLAHK